MVTVTFPPPKLVTRSMKESDVYVSDEDLNSDSDVDESDYSSVLIL